MYPREFSEKVNAATGLIKASYPEAILTIVIDAADNSVTAAQIKHQSCFISDLASMGSFPGGFKLIFTCRTARKPILELPADHTPIAITPFSIKESELFLDKRMGKVTTDELTEFHQLTFGIPRVQSYSILNKSNISDVFTFLKPYGHSVGTLIDSHLRESKLKLGNSALGDQLLMALIVLPRPVPVKYIALVTGASEPEVFDFAKDLWTGLVITSDKISFRDEDFENHLRETYEPNPAYYGTIADLLIANAPTDNYAAANIASVLYHAERFATLKEIVLENKYLEINDPLYKRDVFIERTQLAIRSCTVHEDNETFLKLLVIAAEAAKSNQAQLQIIYNNVELIVENQNLKTIQKLYYNLTSRIEYGAANWQVAAIFSRNLGTSEFARKHLFQADKWIDRRAKKNDDEIRGYHIGTSDIASGGEAVLRLNGVKTAMHWLKRWKPKEMMASVVRKLISKILLTTNEVEQTLWYKDVHRTDLQVIIAVQLIKMDKMSFVDVGALFTKMQAIVNRNFKFSGAMDESLIFLCEKYIGDPHFTEVCLQILKWIMISPPIYNTRFTGSTYTKKDEIGELDHLFRVKCLIAKIDGVELNVNDLLPREIPKPLSEEPTKQQIQQEKRRRESAANDMSKLYERLLPIYDLRADVILNKVGGAVGEKLYQAFETLGGDYLFIHERGHDSSLLLIHATKVLSNTVYFISDKMQALQTLTQIKSHYKIPKQRFLLNIATIAARFVDCYTLVYTLLSEVDNEISDGKSKATDRVETYEECISITELMNDAEESVIYFNKAMEAASDVDLEAHEQIKAINAITTVLSGNEPEPKLAYDLARFTEHSSDILSGYDNFPWLAATRSIAAIDQFSIFSIWCRWDHQDLSVDSDAHFCFWSEQVNNTLLAKQITVDQAAGLTAFYPLDYAWEKIWGNLLLSSQKNGFNNIGQLNKILTHDVGFDDVDSRANYAVKVKELYDRLSIPKKYFPSEIAELININNTYKPDIDRSTETDYHETAPNQSRPTENIELAAVLAKTDPASSEEISMALLSLHEQDKLQIAFTADTFLKGLKDKCPPAAYTAQLDALLTLKEIHLSYYSFKQALEQRLTEWGDKQTVKQWKNENFYRIIENQFLFFKNRFERNEYLDISGLDNLKTLFGKTDQDLGVALKKLVPNIINELPAAVIYQSFAIFNGLLTSPEAVNVLKWIIDRWNKGIPESVAEGVWNERLRPQLDMSENYASFFHYYLGHPDTTERWRVLHTLLRLVENGDTAILTALFSKIETYSCFPFQHAAFPFFTISAKLWFYFAIDHIAIKHPASIAPFLEMIKKELFCTGEQHLLIRKLALSICLKIKVYKNELFSDEDNLLLIKQAELPQRRVKSDETNEGNNIEGVMEYEDDDDFYDEDEVVEKLKFPFDSLDTGPDYYQPLSGIFGIKSKVVYQKAEEAIYGVLNCTTDVIKDDYVSKQDRRISDRGSSFTTLETVQHYYEFHGLFYAADDLLQKYPVVEKGYHTWDEWMIQWGTAWKGQWLSELRDKSPIERRFRTFGSAYTPNWKWTICSDDLDEVCGLANFNKDDFVIINHYDTKAVEHGKETVYVNSALVNKDKANALLNALQTADNPYRYKLPVQNEDYEVTRPKEFSLRAMVAAQDADGSGFDLLDHRSLSLARVKKYPCSEFMEWANGEKSDDGRYTYTSGNPKQILSAFQNWADYDGNIKNHRQGTNGYRLKVNKRKLLEYLGETNYCLLLESQITRRPDSSSHEDREDWTHPIIDAYTKLYLIYPNGTIITTAGNFNAG